VVIATGQRTLKDKNASERKFMAALSEVAQFFADHPEDVAKIYGDEMRAKGFDLPPAVVLQIVKRLNITPERMRLTPEMIQYAQDEASRMKDSGQIDTLPDMKSAMDASVVP
jgi:ABC-type nitrate/sulfonate/bicarbonate transport system substrate-binding protein